MSSAQQCQSSSGHQVQDDEPPVDVPIAKRPDRVRGLNATLVKRSSAHPATCSSPQPPRDPRFDPRCSGSNDVRHFIRNYSFVHDMRRDEVKQLEGALRLESDPEKKHQIKKTISRIKNKLRSLEDENKKLDLVQQLRKSGQDGPAKGRYKNVQKSVIKKGLMVNKFKELKETGKLNKYLERKRKRLIHKDGNI